MLNDSNNKNWWQLEISLAESDVDAGEDAAYLASELGGSGAHFLSDTLFIVYFSGTQSELSQYEAKLRENLLSVTKSAPVEEKNWVQECEEVWTSVTVGDIEIEPILETKKFRKKIYVIPGMGFGTGHHESTRLVLELLQSPEIKNSPPRTVLDLGTGNGVLAFAARALFQSTVTARDIDQNSLNNAWENLELNPQLKPIQFELGSLTSDLPKYDLIMANIYAEVLVPLAPQLLNHLAPAGKLILSGIFDETVHLIEPAFSNKFKLLRKLDENEWSGFLFTTLS